MPDSYRELVVRGDANLLRGFLSGYQLARKIKRGFYVCRDSPINTHHLMEVLTFKGDYIHVILTQRVHEGIVAAIRQAEDMEFTIVSDKPIAKLSFEFKFRTASTKVGARLKRLFDKLPAGLELTRYEPEEEIDPSAKGIEFYSPAHHYQFRGEGEVAGDLDKLFRFRRKLDEHEFIDVERIDVVHGS